MTCDYVKDVIKNQYPSYNAQDCIWFPLVDYGNLYRDWQGTSPRSNDFFAPLQHMRPHFYLNELMKKAFCKIGVPFCSPVLDSEWGSKIITYLIENNYGTATEDTYQLNARATVENDYQMSFPLHGDKCGAVKFPNVEFDNGGILVNTFSQTLRANGEVCVRGTVIGEFGHDVDLEASLQIVKIRKDTFNVNNPGAGGTFGTEVIYEQDISTKEFSIDFEIDGVSLTDCDDFAIIICREAPPSSPATRPSTFIKEGSFLEVEGRRKYWNEGDNVDLKKLIDQNLTVLDLIKGVTNTLNLKFYTDPVTCKVYALQPYEVELLGEIVEGFLKETEVNDYTELIQIKSKDIKGIDYNQARYVKFQFARSTDRYIDEYSQSKVQDDFNKDDGVAVHLKDALWCKTIDLGEQFDSTKTTTCLLYTSPSPRDQRGSRMPSSA